jgi:myo-inositol-1(or 4)-monophosphatase
LTHDYQPYREFAEQAARRAGAILLEAFGKVSAREKAPGDLVTDADLASQRAVAAMIREAYPDHTLLAEEDDVQPDPEKPWRWIVDPLDGTINFSHGNPLWCVSIALEHAGELVAGVVYHPLTDAMHSASLGGGAAVNGTPCGVSAATRLSESLIAMSMPTNFAADADRQMALMARFSTGTHSVRRTGTSAWNLAMLSRGGFDVCYSTALYPWDAAAGVVLVREAGGIVTALDGGHYSLYEHRGILATNGTVQTEAEDAIREATTR